MPDRLPNLWVKTTLGEILRLSRERVAPKEFPDLRYIGLEHIEPHSMRLLDQQQARQARSSSLRFAKGDILYGKMRPYLNKVWVAEFDGLCSAEFLVFKNSPNLNSRFVATRLNSEDFVTFANGKVSGERPRVDFEKLSSFQILLPPLAEQDRIVTKLDAALSSIQRAETATQRAKARITRYRIAVLDAAVNGELTQAWRQTQQTKGRDNAAEALRERLLMARRRRWEDAESRRLEAAGKNPKGDRWKSRYREPVAPRTDGLLKQPANWTWISIDELSWNAGYGTSVKCTYEGKGPAVLRIPNIRNRMLDFDDLKFATIANEFSDDDFVLPGDLLLIRTNGSKDLIGRAAVVLSALPRVYGFASYLIRFRLVGDEALWSWVSLAWDSNLLRSSIELRSATTAGQYNVSLSGLIDLALPLPPLDEQVEIVREVERRMTAVNRLEATLQEQLVRAHATRQSLLREAFSGALVPQDSRDEPASLLLKRIQAVPTDTVQISGGTRMRKSNAKSNITLRPLLDVLREHGGPMTPEQLFGESGYQWKFEENECRQEIVDRFYEELHKLIGQNGPVAERRPDRSTVLLEIKS